MLNVYNLKKKERKINLEIEREARICAKVYIKELDNNLRHKYTCVSVYKHIPQQIYWDTQNKSA